MRRFQLQRRPGNVLVLSLLLMVPMFAMLAFAVDVGYLTVAKSELQRTADSAAMAAAWELAGREGIPADNARAAAEKFAALNPILRESPELGDMDVTVGYLADPTNLESWDFDNPENFNAVRVAVRRDDGQNGSIPLFFARVLGIDKTALQAEATALFIVNINGFQPKPGATLDILPYALKKTVWDDLMAGVNASDSFRYDPDTGQIVPGQDGELEVNLFPQDTGSPGNFGTVDIGSNNNSTADIRRQITDGISEADLEHHGGKLEFDENGELMLNGDTGISAGVEAALESIVGQKRIIPIYETVAGPGNNAMYTIVEFAGVRIMDVNLRGSKKSKRLIIQPTQVKAEGAIPATGAAKTTYIYSPAWLVQ